ncbi:MAG: DEAD/DEAH box helicase family protein [Actinobacteria bacterium]|nr:DEAD/DEAH box helicase family protein [Actinomycetota bacterium]
MENTEVANFFAGTSVLVDGNPRLRAPQIEGYSAAADHFSGDGPWEPAIEQIPVGCGKSGLIAILPFGIAKGRVLVIAPNLTIRSQLMDDLDVTRPDSFYRKTRVIQDSKAVPSVALLDGDANLGDAEDAHIVVTNIHQLAERVDRWLPAFPEDFFDLIVVDEGHHNVASSWQRVFDRFSGAKVISLTATPFRADEQPVHGEVIYQYSFREAMQRGYIKQIIAVNLEPSEIAFTWEGDEHRHSLEELLELKEETWFSRGVALAPECNKHIADASIQWLEYLRNRTGFNHQLIAVACSVAHAKQVRDLYRERNLDAEVIHSGLGQDQRDEIMAALKSGTLDVIVQVQMLGEGFDHPPLSVGAIFRPFRSLNAYIQFVGRIMRVNTPNAANHPDNEGVVVSHVGMNQDSNWDDFKGIDGDDQEVIAGWLNAGGADPPTSGGDGTRRRLRPGMDVTEEIIDRFVSDPYFDQTDDAAIDNLMSVMREQGLDPEVLGLDRDELRRRILVAREKDGAPERLEELPVQPQRRRKILRQQLDEQTRAVAGRICEALDQTPGGVRIALLGGAPGQNNLGVTITRMHRAVNARLGIGSGERRELTLEELERILPELDGIADEVQAELREKLDGED